MNIQVRDTSFETGPYLCTEQPKRPVDLDRFKVQQILLAPGERLTPHFHLHRSEHWIVVSGSGRASIGAETLDLFEGQSLDIAIGAAHAIYNHGKVPLHLIEVQMGICLGAQDHEPLTV